MSMSQYLTKEGMYKDQLKQIADALGTDEMGTNLVEVARNAHKAEQRLASLIRKLTDEFDGEVDITDNGGPNAAMRVMNIVTDY